MHPARLQRIAHQEVRRTLASLPAPIREAAATCRVDVVLISECIGSGEDLPEDLLGLFEGCSRLDDLALSPEQMPRIRLFLDNLWDHAEHDLRDFRQEVRVTVLHELGHYLGFDEAEVERLGLA